MLKLRKSPVVPLIPRQVVQGVQNVGIKLLHEWEQHFVSYLYSPRGPRSPKAEVFLATYI